MVGIRINGEEAAVQTGGLQRVSDLIELIKASIDPEHMITSIRVDGREIADADWFSSLGQHGTAIFEFDTDTPENYFVSRMSASGEIIRLIYIDFRDSRKLFQQGDMFQGNRKLAVAVNSLKAFFEWYASMVDLAPEADRPRYQLTDFMNEIAESCKRICQQQLYQSWWALSESLEKDLEPKLDKLEDFLRRTFKPAQ